MTPYIVTQYTTVSFLSEDEVNTLPLLS